MSRIGRKPINIPAGVTVTVDANVVTVKGPKATLTQAFHPNMTISVEGNEILVTRPNDDKENRSLHGLTRTLIHNMVVGVTEGFKKELDVNGVGYRVQMNGKNLPTSRPSASLPLRSARSVRPSRTRARVSAILASLSVIRKARPVRAPRSKKE